MGEERTPCPACGDTRLAFDEAYQPRCFTCGASRVQASSLEPPSAPGPILPSGSPTLAGPPAASPPPASPGAPPTTPSAADWHALARSKPQRSPEEQRRNLVIVVAIVMVVIGLIFGVIIASMAPKEPRSRLGAIPAVGGLTGSRAATVSAMQVVLAPLVPPAAS